MTVSKSPPAIDLDVLGHACSHVIFHVVTQEPSDAFIDAYVIHAIVEEHVGVNFARAVGKYTIGVSHEATVLIPTKFASLGRRATGAIITTVIITEQVTVRYFPALCKLKGWRESTSRTAGPFIAAVTVVIPAKSADCVEVAAWCCNVQHHTPVI